MIIAKIRVLKRNVILKIVLSWLLNDLLYNTSLLMEENIYIWAQIKILKFALQKDITINEKTKFHYTFF